LCALVARDAAVNLIAGDAAVGVQDCRVAGSIATLGID
jgi:hypothetical protein